MARIHNSNKPIKALRNWESQVVSRKPGGMWWALDDAWTKLVNQKTFMTNKKVVGSFNYEVILQTDANVLQLSSVAAVEEFSEHFACALPWATSGAPKDRMVDWMRVSSEYDGIEILVLNKPEGIIKPWLSDWCIPSGCIWSTRAIKSLCPVS